MMRVLCVEDDPVVRTFLTHRLRVEPDVHLVKCVANVQSAIACLCRESVDVILLDQNLHANVPGPDGTDLLQVLNAWPREGGPAQEMPRVLFCTGQEDPEFENTARQFGAAGVVGKSSVSTDLVPALRAVARGKEWYPRTSEKADTLPRRWSVALAEPQGRFRVWLVETLEEMGCAVSCAWRTDGIPSLLEQQSFHLLMMGCRLPGQLRATDVLDDVERRWAALPVILLAYQQPEMRDYRPAANVRSVLTHQCSAAELRRTMERALQVGIEAGAAVAAAG